LPKYLLKSLNNIKLPITALGLNIKLWYLLFGATGSRPALLRTAENGLCSRSCI